MCPSCSRHLVEIDVRLGDITVTMHACSRCDRRWWERDGQTLELRTVLKLAAAS